MHAFFRPIVHDLRTLPRGVWVLVGGQFINRFGSFVYPFLALFLTQRGLTLAHVGWVMAALALGQLAAPFVGGYLADAIGRRRTIVLALVGGALTLLGLYAMRSPLALAVMAGAHGFFAYMFNPAASALLSDLVPEEKRVTAFAMLRLAINAGFAAGPAIAGLLFRIDPLYIFIGDAGTTLVFAALALAFLPRGHISLAGATTSPRSIARNWLQAGRDAWHNGPFVQLFVCQLLMTVAFMQIFTVLSLHATARGLDTAAYGLAMGFNGLIIMTCELTLAHVLKRADPRRVLILGYIITGLGCASFALATGLLGFLAAMAIFTLGEMIALPISSGYASTLAPADYRGRYFGLLGTSWGFGGLLGSSGAWVYGQIGPIWWVIAGACSVLGGIGMAARWRDRRTNQTSELPTAG